MISDRYLEHSTNNRFRIANDAIATVTTNSTFKKKLLKDLFIQNKTYHIVYLN